MIIPSLNFHKELTFFFNTQLFAAVFSFLNIELLVFTVKMAQKRPFLTCFGIAYNENNERKEPLPGSDIVFDFPNEARC